LEIPAFSTILLTLAFLKPLLENSKTEASIMDFCLESDSCVNLVVLVFAEFIGRI